jgi:hypothetical protein
MRSFALLSLLFLAILPHAFAANQITIAQLEQLLHENKDKSDAKVAHQLADLELNQRASTARLTRWESTFPGPRTREALTLLADASSFLDLPPDDISNQPPPDPQSDHDILLRTIDYAVKTIPVLPNFMATRSTIHFEDTPLRQHFDEDTVYQPLHATGTTSVPVTYRDGHEVAEAPAADARKHDADIGLTTSGEFGPVLSVVLGDAFRSHMEWSHWEQGASGRIAVYRYYVPQPQSHYLVEFHPGADLVRLYPAYRGEIAIDPATGNVLRITAIADLAPPWQHILAAILVEFAPVAIGDRTYICPVKGVALSKMPLFETDSPTTAPLKTRLNDVAFTQYHRFRADVRIVPAGQGPLGASATNHP